MTENRQPIASDEKNIFEKVVNCVRRRKKQKLNFFFFWKITRFLVGQAVTLSVEHIDVNGEKQNDDLCVREN